MSGTHARRQRGVALVALGGLVGGLGAVVSTTGVVHADQVVVDTLLDAGNGASTSLREAIGQANSSSAITEIVLGPAGTYVLNICPGLIDGDDNFDGDLDYTGTQDLVIRSADSSTRTIQQTCGRVFDIRPGAGQVTFRHLTITGGTLPAWTRPDTDGGGVRASNSDLVFEHTSVTNNAAGDGTAGDAGGRGGGVYLGSGTITLTDSTVTGNAAGDGGNRSGIGTGVAGRGGDGGGIYLNSGTVSATRTTFRLNRAGDGGSWTSLGGGNGGAGGWGGGVYVFGPSGSIFATASTVELNDAGDGGDADTDGGDGGSGGGLAAASVNVIGSDVTSNGAGEGGAGYSTTGEGGDGGGVAAIGALSNGSRFRSNRAGRGGFSPLTSGDPVVPGGQGGDGGGIAALGGSIAIAGSTFDANAAGGGGDGTSGGLGGHGGAAAVGLGDDPTLSVSNSVFVENEAGSAGDGPTSATDGYGGDGGALYNQENVNGAVDVTNSTFRRNAAGNGPFGREGTGAAIATNNVTLAYTTIMENRSGMAVSNTGGTLASFDFITASIIGDNEGGNCDLAASQSGGYNVEGGVDSCHFDATTDRVNVAGLSDSLTWDATAADAFVPVAGSFLDAMIPAASCSSGPQLGGITTDQRNEDRPRGDGCEPGAIEIVGETTGGGPGGGPGGGIGAELDAAAKFVPLSPVRLFDTRPDETPPGPKGRLAAGQVIEVQVAGEAGVPANAVAVVMNLTATETDGPSFVSAFPTGTVQPNASAINIQQTGQTRPNLVTVKIGAGGKVSLYSLAAAHLLGDVAGYYVDQDAATTAGRFVPLSPDRLFDTRPGEPAPGPKGTIASEDTIVVQATGRSGIPDTGVAAIVVNVTATESSAAGFVTGYPTGDDRPNASIVNVDGPGRTAPNLAIIPVGDGGTVSFYSFGGTHLLGDVTGYITSSAATSSTAGLFVPLEPVRVFDTREEYDPPGPKGFVAADSSIDAQVAGAVGIPSSASAVSLNVVGIDAGLGFLTAWETGQTMPLASTLNFEPPLDVRANAAMLPIGAGGKISFYTFGGSDMLADTAGYFIG